MQADEVLSSVFGYASFRSHQADIVETVINGGDALVLMPTGGGKSLCYQVPALVRSGTAIVVSPLIALMQDQVDALEAVGVNAAFLNSTQDWSEQDRIVSRMRSGDLDFLYVAPERLVQERTLDLLSDIEIALFAIDEAHCVSQWGHDFRPEYRQLRILASRFPKVPRMALTATADQRTRAEIADELALGDARQFIASFDRPNIRYTISEGGKGSARDQLWRFISENHADEAGIVYCLSRRAVEETAYWLTTKGRTALPYHAGLDQSVRAKTQARFLAEEDLIIVATIAFGMGIDKPDVRFVAHMSLPKSVEAYYQETGRAGRDGAPANAWMMYGMQDIGQQRSWIEKSDGTEAHQRMMHQKLDALVGLCETTACRRQSLLGYFDEDLAKPCGNCDNCLNPPTTIDGSVLAQKALSAIYRTGERFGATYITNVLLGKADQRIVQNRHDQLPLFGIGQDLDAPTWRGVLRQLLARGVIRQDADGHQTLALTGHARPILKGEEPFEVRKPRADKGSGRGGRSRGSGARAATSVPANDRPLFEALREARKELATDAGVPPYVVCHDKTLVELAIVKPNKISALDGITGLGKTKIARFGAVLVDVITQHEGLGATGRAPDHVAAAEHSVATADEVTLSDDYVPALREDPDAASTTIQQTVALLRDGKSVDDVAGARGIKTSTVYQHAAEAIELGLVAFDDVVDLDAAERDAIEAA
ncbi:MAG: DNA helicase RecQ, partial [Pseudomonadota bacterium]